MERALEWPARHEITDPEAINVLSDLRALEYLTPFLIDQHTLSSAAGALGCATSTLSYWIRRFRRVGLLIHLGDQQRAGMPMPVYRAPATQLVVPFALLPFDRRVALLDGGRMRILRRFLDGLDETIARERTFSLGFSSDRPKGFTIDMVETATQKQARGYTDGWRTIMLSVADAHDLARDIDALVDKYDARPRGPRRYILHAGIVPAPRHRWRSIDDPAFD